MIFNRLKLAVDRVIAAFSVAVMLALVVCVVWQVFSRYVLNQPSTLTDELARFLGSDSNLLIVFYVQIMPDDLVMQLHRF